MAIKGVTCINPSKIHEPSQYAHDDDPPPEQLGSLPAPSLDIELVLATLRDLGHMERGMPSADSLEFLEWLIADIQATSSLDIGQPSRTKRRLSSVDLDEEDGHADYKRPRTDDTENDVEQPPADDDYPILNGAHGTSSTSIDSSLTTAAQSPNATLPPATPADTVNDAELADTSEDVEPVATLDTSEDKEASTPASSATEVSTADIDPTLSNAPSSTPSSAPVSAHSAAPVQGAVGLSVSASAPTPTLQSPLVTPQFVPNVPPGTVTVAVGAMANISGITLELPPNIASHYRRILSNPPPPATVASMAAAAPPIAAPAAPAVVAPPMANTGLGATQYQATVVPSTIQPPATAPAAIVAPAVVQPAPTAPPTTTASPATAPPMIAPVAGAPTQPPYTLWQSTPLTTVDTSTWGIHYTSGEPIDLIYRNLFLHSVRTSNASTIAYEFEHPGNPFGTPPTCKRDIRFGSPQPGELPSYTGFKLFEGISYHKDVIEAFPYLSMRALEQRRFQHVFHCKVNGSKWRCPHCGKNVKSQMGVLTKHFKECSVLQYVEQQVAAANP
ncbi:hypothetical protein CYLTODRAFT_492166 [Cylindrobasidium torrendii FP15055 ss-10]|uniref:Uncharacterized protein n=1 Tax=Cylindrobasidium torrendii FP15055 ss-10 TaxID=1314674 RepID=A0A0D7B520_9AGAR|nr:hypothetical protein CYLTODRAFT_492166 [Cylindrobasidium torrendii FP15055 ss-10]